MGEGNGNRVTTFNPAERTSDALRLLEAARAEEYVIARRAGGDCSVEIRIAGKLGEAKKSSEALAITLAIARSLGIDVDAKGDR